MGVLMSHVDLKKVPCHPVDFKKTSCCHVNFKKVPCRMSLKAKKGSVAVSILGAYTPCDLLTFTSPLSN